MSSPPSGEEALESLLCELDGPLRYDATQKSLTYHEREIRLDVEVPAEVVLTWLDHKADGALEVFAGPPRRAAARLAMVHVAEDIETGKDPFRFVEQADQRL